MADLDECVRDRINEIKREISFLEANLAAMEQNYLEEVKKLSGCCQRIKDFDKSRRRWIKDIKEQEKLLKKYD